MPKTKKTMSPPHLQPSSFPPSHTTPPHPPPHAAGRGDRAPDPHTRKLALSSNSERPRDTRGGKVAHLLISPKDPAPAINNEGPPLSSSGYDPLEPLGRSDS